MSLFYCPTHGLHQGQFCPAGNEIAKCAGPSTYVTFEQAKKTDDRAPINWNFTADDESYT